MAPVTVEKLIQNIELGEGPHWHIATQTLYFVDIFSKTINKYVPATGKHTKAYLDDMTTFIIPIRGEKNKFVVGHGRNISEITWDGENEKVGNIKILTQVDNQPDVLTNRLNDAKCDASGRLWAGTMGEEIVLGQVKPNMGSLYSYQNGDLKKHFNSVGISNGIVWNKDNTKMFYVDSHKRTIDQFQFDLETGNISERKIFFSLNKHGIDGFPDGMTIDVDENLWLAVFNGYRVIKISSQTPETLLDTIALPAKQVTSVAWGGPNLDELYVTSAKFTVDGNVLNPPDHGTLFKITGLGTNGTSMYEFK